MLMPSSTNRIWISKSKDRGYKLVSVGKTFVYPIAGYSKKSNLWMSSRTGSQVAVPNDPTNLVVPSLLLQK